MLKLLNRVLNRFGYNIEEVSTKLSPARLQYELKAAGLNQLTTADILNVSTASVCSAIKGAPRLIKLRNRIIQLIKEVNGGDIAKAS